MTRTKEIITSHVRHILKRAGEGQGLVELMIIMPLLLLFFIGVFEVGWALRGYLVLTNANREITRFAVRPGYLDYSDYSLALDNVETIGYDDIANHLFTVLGRDQNDPAASPGQLPVELGQNSTLIISHIVAETGRPCRYIDPTDPTLCDCSWFDDLNYRTNPDDSQYEVNPPGGGPKESNILLLDDLIIHPGQTGEEFHAATYPPTSTVTTRLDYEPYALELARQNDKFNCELLNKTDSAVPSANNVVVTELFYDQPQLIGFPGLSNSLTDPLPMYSQTTMRLTVGARGGNPDTNGPVCYAMPFLIKEPELVIGSDGEPTDPQSVDILGGAGGSDSGWLGWNPINSQGGSSATYLADELNFEKYITRNDFTNVDDPDDHKLSEGDWVASVRGLTASELNSAHNILGKLKGKTFYVPVWSGNGSDFDQKGTGSAKRYAYKIKWFAKVRLDSLPTASQLASTKNLPAVYLGKADNCDEPTP